jgi:hypothetical protein
MAAAWLVAIRYNIRWVFVSGNQHQQPKIHLL